MATTTREAHSARQPNVLTSESYVPQVMPRTLGTWDMTATFIAMVYLATGATTAAAGGAAAITYLLLGAFTFFIPSLLVTAQLGVFFPYEGSLYNWTHRTLGGYWSFFSGFCAWFPSVLIISSFANLLITYVQAMRADWLSAPWQQGLVIIVVLLLGSFVCLQRLRMIQYIINGMTILACLASVLIGLSCIVWFATGHHSLTSFSHVNDWSINPSNFALFGLVAFAYIGTEGPLNMAGEMKQEQKIITRHLLWGGLLLFVLYIIDTIAVLVVQGNNGTAPFALVSTVDVVLGKGVGNIATICLMGSFISPVLVYNYVFARLLFVASVDRRLPLAFSKLNKNRAPANAIFFQTAVAVLFTIIAFIAAPTIASFKNPADFSTEVYYVTQAAAVLVWAISALFLFVDLVAYYRRDRQGFLRQLILPLPILWIAVLVGSASCLLAIVDTLLFSWISLISNSQWWYIVGSLTFFFLLVGALGGMYGSSEAYWQDLATIDESATRQLNRRR